MKPKIAIVPRWESPATKRTRFEIRRMEFLLRRGISDRREREGFETALAEARTRLG